MTGRVVSLTCGRGPQVSQASGRETESIGEGVADVVVVRERGGDF